MKQLLTLLLIPCFCFSQKKDTVQIVGKLKDSTVDVLRFNRVTFSATTGIGDLPDSIRRLLTSSWTAPANRENSLTITPKQDTVKVLMLVCDTGGLFHSTMKYFSPCAQASNDGRCVWWQYGYEVKESCGHILSTFPIGSTCPHFPSYSYLDQNKKPLPKSIIVWMSKEIK